jgi:hypothetical protein
MSECLVLELPALYQLHITMFSSLADIDAGSRLRAPSMAKTVHWQNKCKGSLPMSSV